MCSRARMDNMEQKSYLYQDSNFNPLAIQATASSYIDCFIPVHIDKQLTAHNYTLMLMRMYISVDCAVNNNNHIMSTYTKIQYFIPIHFKTIFLHLQSRHLPEAKHSFT
jgi:hypothetical protein